MTKRIISLDEIDTAFNLAEQNTFAPSIFIGCGGYGTMIVNQLKNRYNQFFDDGSSDPFPYAKFYYLDTDTLEISGGLKKVSLSTQEAEHLPLKPDASIENLVAKPCVSSWFPKHQDFRQLQDCIDRIAGDPKGAGTCRPFGRLGLYTAGNARTLYGRLEEMVLKLYQDCQQLQVQRSGKVHDLFNNAYTLRDPGNIYFHVISSLGGGTGTSLFLTVAAVIRTLLNNHHDRNEWTNLTFNINLILMSPTTIANPSGGAEEVAANSYAALKEMDTLLSSAATYIDDLDGLQIKLKSGGPYPLANNVFLFDNPNSDPDRCLKERINFAELVSDCLFQLSIGEVGNQFWSRNMDNKLKFDQYPKNPGMIMDSRTTRYYAMGAAHYELPLGYLLEKIGYEFIKDFLTGKAAELEGSRPGDLETTELENRFKTKIKYQSGIDGFFSDDAGKIWKEKLLFDELELLAAGNTLDLRRSRYFPYHKLVLETPEDESDYLQLTRETFLDSLKRYHDSKLDRTRLTTGITEMLGNFQDILALFIKTLDAEYPSVRNRAELLSALRDLLSSQLQIFKRYLDNDKLPFDRGSLQEQREVNYNKIRSEIETYTTSGILRGKWDEIIELYRQTIGKIAGGKSLKITDNEKNLIRMLLDEFIGADRKLDEMEYRLAVYQVVHDKFTNEIMPQLKAKIDEWDLEYHRELEEFKAKQIREHEISREKSERLADIVQDAGRRINNRLATYDFKSGEAYYTSFDNTRFYPNRDHNELLLAEIALQLKAAFKESRTKANNFQKQAEDKLVEVREGGSIPEPAQHLIEELLKIYKQNTGVYADQAFQTINWDKVEEAFGLSLASDSYYPHSTSTPDSTLGNKVLGFIGKRGMPFVDLQEPPSSERVWNYLVGPPKLLDRIRNFSLFPNATSIPGLYDHQLSLYSFLIGFSTSQLKGINNWYAAYCAQTMKGYPTHTIRNAEFWPEACVSLIPASKQRELLQQLLKNKNAQKHASCSPPIITLAIDTLENIHQFPVRLNTISFYAAAGTDAEYEKIALFFASMNERQLAESELTNVQFPKNISGMGTGTDEVEWGIPLGSDKWLITVGTRLQAVNRLLTEHNLPLFIAGTEEEWIKELEINHLLYCWCSRMLLNSILHLSKKGNKTAKLQRLVDNGILSPLEETRARIYLETHLEL